MLVYDKFGNYLDPNISIDCVDDLLGDVPKFIFEGARVDPYMEFIVIHTAAYGVLVDYIAHHLSPEEAGLLLAVSVGATGLRHGFLYDFAHSEGLAALHEMGFVGVNTPFLTNHMA